MILNHLLEHTKLEDLEIEGGTVPATASGRKLILSDTSNVKTIRLSVGSKASTIQLIDLLSIARSHLDLVSLSNAVSKAYRTSPPSFN
jgi:hypothetical protein